MDHPEQLEYDGHQANWAAPDTLPQLARAGKEAPMQMQMRSPQIAQAVKEAPMQMQMRTRLWVGGLTGQFGIRKVSAGHQRISVGIR